ncbi:hypothetical protein HY486_01700 [Candidatus Woesearchaeota archaeon]|nr:hypothetical protein [Candidatus Woesearchaeota archaeon]
MTDYSKKSEHLTQAQVIESLKAVFISEHFKRYRVNTLKYSLASLRVNVSVEKTAKVEGIAELVTTILNAISIGGELEDATLELTLSDEMLKSMEFEKGLYECDLELPLTFNVIRETPSENHTYCLSISNLGLNEAYFQSQGLNLKNAQKKVSQWYRNVTSTLNKLLPNKLKNRTWKDYC